MRDITDFRGEVEELRTLKAELEDKLRLYEAQERFVYDFFQQHADHEKSKKRRRDEERLAAVRAQTTYELAYRESEPLISVIVPTYSRAVTILERTLPSVQAQDYENWELLIVGDQMDSHQAALLEDISDSRVRFYNLKKRGRYPERRGPRWYVAGNKPANFGLKIARGLWIAHLDDDDEFKPNFVGDLLTLARANYAEWVHGNVLFVSDDGYPPEVIGEAEPKLGTISRISSLYHGCLKGFQYNPGAWKYFCPGDWDLWDRFLEMGVRHAHLPQLVGIHHGSRYGAWREYGYEPALPAASRESSSPNGSPQPDADAKDSEALYADAEQLLERGDHAEALAVLHRLLELDPQHAMAHNDAGVLCYQNGQVELAHTLLQRAHRLSPDSFLILRNLVSVLSSLNEHGRALQSLASFVKRNPGEREAQEMLQTLTPETEDQSASAAVGRVSPHSQAADVEEKRLAGQPVSGLEASSIPTPAESAALEVRKISTYEEFEQHCRERQDYFMRVEQKEAQLVRDHKPFHVPGYCYVCQTKSEFLVDFNHCSHRDGKPIPNWRERMVCPTCGLNNRLRASVHLFEQACGVKASDHIYITEQVSPLFRTLAKQYPNLVGSEFLGDAVARGSRDARGIRNESLTELSFDDNAFDHIMTFDVLEHVPDYRRALEECFRCLKPGGTLMFSVPFARSSRTNIVRAKLDPAGNVEHLLPPEYHGDPVNPGDGCLCYYHFGWELLDEIRDLGFEDVTALYYWSADLGYLGGEQSVFFATKPCSQYQLKTAGL